MKKHFFTFFNLPDGGIWKNIRVSDALRVLMAVLFLAYGFNAQAQTNCQTCCNGSKPKTLVMVYNGKSCAQTVTCQAAGKWACTGSGPNNAASVYIVVTKNSDGSGTPFFQGTVNLNASFTVNSITAWSSTFPANTYFSIYNKLGGVLLQRIQIHTSCSTPLVAGDQIGAVTIQSIVLANNTTCNSPTPPQDCPTPVITINNTTPTNVGEICKGDQITFKTTDLGFPCIIYSWNFGNNATPATATGIGPHTVTYSATGTFTVSLTIDNDCAGGTGSTICKGTGGGTTPGTGGTDCCDKGDKPKSLTLLYNGQSCASSNTSQSLSKYSCSDVGGGPNGKSSVYIKASEKEDGTGKIYFTGNVNINSSFVVNASTANATEFPANTYFKIYASQGGALLQKVKIHTSCSAPLIPGDQFGSLVLLSAQFKNGSSCGPVTPPGPDCTPCKKTVTASVKIKDCPPPAVGKIGDFVWADNNSNGIQDANEPGVPSVFVMLMTCAGTFVASTFTDANGMYMFNNLQAGSYRVFFGNPNPNIYMITLKDQGGDDAKDSDIGLDGWTDCFNLGQGQTNLTIDAGLKPMAPPCVININITNIVCDGKGTATTTDDTYTFTMTVTGGNGNAWTGGFSHACLGAFAIGPTPYNTPVNLGPFPAGEFTCPNVFPPLVLQNGVNIDISVTDVQNANCTKGTTVLSPGPCSPPPTASLGDFVWNDLNQNGIQNAGEPGVPGVTVRLFRCDNTFVAQTSTNASGLYLFPNLTPNTQYFVEFSNLPAGFQFTTANAGADNIDSDANTANGRTDCIFLGPGENNLTVDAGIFQPATPQKASVGDFVWDDKNENGIQDAGEPGVQGVSATLFRCDNNAFVGQFTTTATGFYQFLNLDPNTSYFVQFTNLPAGYQFTLKDAGGNDAIDSDADPGTGRTDCFFLAPGQHDPTRDAGIFKPATPGPAKIGDFVWFDTNANGVQNPGEPGIPNVFVILETCAGVFVNFAVTDANGMYMFNNVTPGQYRIKFANPGNYNGIPLQFTIQDAGGNDATDSDADWLGFTNCFTVNPGEVNLTYDAGLTGQTPGEICVLNGSVSNIVCANGQFTFTLIVNGTNTGDWGYDIPALGLFMLQFGQPYNLGPFPGGSTLTLLINDHDVADCTTTVTVQSPPNCTGGTTCDNVTNGGTIGNDESNCAAFDPANIVSLTPPSGGSGTLEYQWLSSTSGCPNNVNQAIPGATGATYDPPFINVTTWYVRMARRTGCTQWVPSNCVKKEVKTCPPSGCNVSWTPGPGKITISGLSASNVDVKVFNASWATVFSCFNNCNNPQVVNVPAGTYYVSVQLWDAAWQQICKQEGYVTVSSFAGNDGGANAAGLVDNGNVTNGLADGSPAVQDRNGSTDSKLTSTTSSLDLHLFPNPASNFALVHWGNATAWDKAELVVLNQLGQVVKTIQLDDAATGSYRLELGDMRSGQYIVQFRIEGEAPAVRKLIVNR